MNINEMKKRAAESAFAALKQESFESIQLGIGTGSTVNLFIELLKDIKHRIKAVAASSNQSRTSLKSHGIPYEETNMINGIDIYIDGADEIDEAMRMIKGGGGALTGEKILACQSRQFWCIADESKKVDILGTFPVAVEVVLDARSMVARNIMKLGGNPEYRQGFISDYGNPILDVYNLNLTEPVRMEQRLNNEPGVVCNGIFAVHPATRLFCAHATSVEDRSG